MVEEETKPEEPKAEAPVEQKQEPTEQKQETIEQTPEQVRKEVSELKAKLDELNVKKEEWFKKKEELKAQIADMISKIKGAKSKNDESSKSIAEFKEKRDKFNSEVKQLIAKIKDLKKKKDDMLAKAKFKGDPLELKSQIDRMEHSLETQAFSFDKEKKIMKQINALKKQYDSFSGMRGLFEEIDDVSRKITEAKRQSDEFHARVRGYAADNKENFGDFIKFSKDITSLKKVQAEAFDNFIKFKKEFIEANRQLQEKLEILNKDRDNENRERKKKAKEKRDEIEVQLKHKVDEVKDKLKKRKKLTTEDIIAYQGQIEDTEDF